MQHKSQPSLLINASLLQPILFLNNSCTNANFFNQCDVILHASLRLVHCTGTNYLSIKSDWVNRIIKDGMYRTSISGKYIAALPPMPKTIIFGNMCYSGWILTSVSIPEKKWLSDNKVYTIPATIKYFENPIGKAFIERNLISYYGFTRNEYKRNDIIWPKGSSRSVRIISPRKWKRYLYNG